MKLPIYFLILFLFASCDFLAVKDSVKSESVIDPVIKRDTLRADSVLPLHLEIERKVMDTDTSLDRSIRAAGLTSDKLVEFALTLVGIPYKYASTDPAQGFDCSGFITYVFNHFKISVPRSSRDFENVGVPVDVQVSRQGDLILFTGTDSTERTIGHMGIIISNENGNVLFIHSSSGKVYGVVITPLNDYYKSRFVKVIRVFR